MWPAILGGAALMGGLSYLGAQNTNAANQRMNDRNIEFQRETNAQNEALMRESWERDDNAVQRRRADLEAAGLSPLLAAGDPAGNSGPVSMTAPQQKIPELGKMAAFQQGMQQAVQTGKTLMDMGNQLRLVDNKIDIDQKTNTRANNIFKEKYVVKYRRLNYRTGKPEGPWLTAHQRDQLIKDGKYRESQFKTKLMTAENNLKVEQERTEKGKQKLLTQQARQLKWERDMWLKKQIAGLFSSLTQTYMRGMSATRNTANIMRSRAHQRDAEMLRYLRLMRSEDNR